MSYPELLDAARALPREEQLRLASALLDDPTGHPQSPADEALLAQMFPPGVPHEVWSPHDACEAAVALRQLLDEPGAK